MKVPVRMIPLLVLAAGLPLAAQEPAPEGANVEIGESIDVRVVNVEAVVTDRHGQRIKGLNPADFRLLVDGKEVPIDYFTEIRGGAAVEARGEGPAAPVSGTVGRNLLVFIDQNYSIQAQLDHVLGQLDGDLGRLAPGDQIALVAADREGHLKILTDWTSDVAPLRAAIARLRQEPTGGLHYRVALDSLENDRILLNLAATGNAWGDSPSLMRRTEVGNWWDDLRAGRQPRSLSILERDVAGEDETAIWADDSFGAAVLASMRAFSSAPGRKVMVLFSGGWPGGQDPSIVEAANLLGYSLYPVDVSGLQASAVPSQAQHVGLAAAGANQSYDGFITSDFEQRIHYGFETLARDTGGKASINGLRETALERTLEDTEAYYWLGFSPVWNADGKRHDIRLEVQGSGLKVRARRSYSDLSLRAQQALEAQSRRVLEAAVGSGSGGGAK
jgi:VWFA-related protein